MPIRDIVFRDVTALPKLTEKDYKDAPQRVKSAFDKLVNMIATSGQIPNSMQAHDVENDSLGVYIGYVTVTGDHWRVLFTWRNGVVVFLRLMNHDKMDIHLRNRWYIDDMHEFEKFWEELKNNNGHNGRAVR